jgi:heme-degrading monooxygenase HmoA
MVQFVEMDDRVSLADQLKAEDGPVVLVNKFTVAENEAEQLLEAWRIDAGHFKAQPGFISTQLHRGIAGSGVFLNCAVWESVADFRRAFESPAVRQAFGNYPASAIGAPHLFRKLAVPGICLA